MVLNPDRLQGISEQIREAQRLAQEETHSSHGHRMMCRLAGMLTVCRDLADDLLEQAVQGEQRHHRHGRSERAHF